MNLFRDVVSVGSKIANSFIASPRHENASFNSGLITWPEIQFGNEGDEGELNKLWSTYQEVHENEAFEIFLKKFICVFDQWKPSDKILGGDKTEKDEKNYEKGSFGKVVIGCSFGHPTQVIMVFVKELKNSLNELSKDTERTEDIQIGLNLLEAITIISRSDHNRKIFLFFEGFEALMRLMKSAVIRLKSISPSLMRGSKTSPSPSLSSLSTHSWFLQCFIAHIVSILATIIDAEIRENRKKFGAKLNTRKEKARSANYGIEEREYENKTNVDIADKAYGFTNSLPILESGGLIPFIDLLRLLRELYLNDIIPDFSLERLSLRTLKSVITTNPKMQNHLRSISAFEVLLNRIGWPNQISLVEQKDNWEELIDEFDLQFLALKIIRETLYLNYGNITFFDEINGFSRFTILMKWTSLIFSDFEVDNVNIDSTSTSNLNSSPISSHYSSKGKNQTTRTLLENQKLALSNFQHSSQYVFLNEEDDLRQWNHRTSEVFKTILSLLGNFSQPKFADFTSSHDNSSKHYLEFAVKKVILTFLNIFIASSQGNSLDEKILEYFRFHSFQLQKFTLFTFRTFLSNLFADVNVYRESKTFEILFSNHFFYFGIAHCSELENFSVQKKYFFEKNLLAPENFELPHKFFFDEKVFQSQSSDNFTISDEENFTLPEKVSENMEKVSPIDFLPQKLEDFDFQTILNEKYFKIINSPDPHSLRLETLLFVESLATDQNIITNKTECEILFKELQRCILFPKLFTSIAQCLLRILETSTQITIQSFLDLNVISLLSKIFSLQQTFHSKTILFSSTFSYENSSKDEDKNKDEIQEVKSITDDQYREKDVMTSYRTQNDEAKDTQEKIYAKKAVSDAFWSARLSAFQIFEDFLSFSETAKFKTFKNWKALSALFDLLLDDMAREFALKTITTLMIMEMPPNETWSNKIGIFSKFVEIFPQAKFFSQKFGIQILIDLLLGLKYILQFDIQTYQTLFLKAECLVQIISLLNEDYEKNDGKILCIEIISTLTILVQENVDAKNALRELLGLGYDVFFKLLLERYESEPDKRVLSALLDFLVDGGFDMSNKYIIQNEDAVPLFFRILYYCDEDAQSFGFKTFQSLLEASTSNLACCVRTDLMKILLEFFGDPEISFFHREIELMIQTLGNFSISGKDMSQIFSILKKSDMDPKSKLSQSSSLLRMLQSMIQVEGPPAFFEFDGNKSVIEFLKPAKLPNRNFSFCCWLRVENFSSAKHTGLGIFNFFTDFGKGYSATLFEDHILINSNGSSSQSAKINFHFHEKKWVFLFMTHNLTRSFPSSSHSFKLYIDGKLIDTVKLNYPKFFDSLTNCSIGGRSILPQSDYSNDNISGPENYSILYPESSSTPGSTPVSEHFKGQIGSIYFFDDCISAPQIESIFNLGPSYMYSFLSSESYPTKYSFVSTLFDPKDGISSKIIASYNAQASSGVILFNTSPNYDSGKENLFSDATLAGNLQLCCRQSIKDTIQCVGGISVLFPLFIYLKDLMKEKSISNYDVISAAIQKLSGSVEQIRSSDSLSVNASLSAEQSATDLPETENLKIDQSRNENTSHRKRVGFKSNTDDIPLKKNLDENNDQLPVEEPAVATSNTNDDSNDGISFSLKMQTNAGTTERMFSSTSTSRNVSRSVSRNPSFVLRDNLVLEILGLFTSILADNESSQEYILTHSGFSILSFLLKKVSPKLLNVNVVWAFENLLGCLAHGSDGDTSLKLVNDLISKIYLDFSLWICTSYSTQRELFSSLSRQIQKDLPQKFGPSFLLNIRSVLRLHNVLENIMQFYFDTPRISSNSAFFPCFSSDIKQVATKRPQLSDIMKLRKIFLELSEPAWRDGFTRDETRVLFAFIENNNHPSCLEDVLLLLLSLMKRKKFVSVFVNHVYDLGGCQLFFSLLSSEIESIRLISLNIICGLYLSTPNDKKISKHLISTLSKIEKNNEKLNFGKSKMFSISFFSIIEKKLSVFPMNEKLFVVLFDLLLGTFSSKKILKEDLKENYFPNMDDPTAEKIFALPEILPVIFKFSLSTDWLLAKHVLEYIFKLLKVNSTNQQTFIKDPYWQDWIFCLLSEIDTRKTNETLNVEMIEKRTVNEVKNDEDSDQKDPSDSKDSVEEMNDVMNNFIVNDSQKSNFDNENSHTNRNDYDDGNYSNEILTHDINEISERFAKDESYASNRSDFMSEINNDGNINGGRCDSANDDATCDIEDVIILKLELKNHLKNILSTLHSYCIIEEKNGWKIIERTFDFLFLYAQKASLSFLPYFRELLFDLYLSIVKKDFSQTLLNSQPIKDNVLYLFSLIDELTIMEENIIFYPSFASETEGELQGGILMTEDENTSDTESVSSFSSSSSMSEGNTFLGLFGKRAEKVSQFPDLPVDENGWPRKSFFQDTESSKGLKWKVFEMFWILLESFYGRKQTDIQNYLVLLSTSISSSSSSSSSSISSSPITYSPVSSVVPTPSRPTLNPSPTFNQRAKSFVESLNAPTSEITNIIIGSFKNESKRSDRVLKLRGDKMPRIIFRLVLIYLHEASLQQVSEFSQKFFQFLPEILSTENENMKNRIQYFLWCLSDARSKIGSMDSGYRIHIISEIIKEIIDKGKSLFENNILDKKIFDTPSLHDLFQQDRISNAIREDKKSISFLKNMRTQEVHCLYNEMKNLDIVTKNVQKIVSNSIQNLLSKLVMEEKVKIISRKLHHDSQRQLIWEKWIQIYRNQTSERGAWGDIESANKISSPKQKAEGAWKLDKMEDPIRRRLRLRPNYRFDPSLKISSKYSHSNADLSSSNPLQEEKAKDKSWPSFRTSSISQEDTHVTINDGQLEDMDDQENEKSMLDESDVDISDGLTFMKNKNIPSHDMMLDSNIDSLIFSSSCVLINAKRKVAGLLEIKRKKLFFYGRYIVFGNGNSSVFDENGEIQSIEGKSGENSLKSIDEEDLDENINDEKSNDEEESLDDGDDGKGKKGKKDKSAESYLKNKGDYSFRKFGIPKSLNIFHDVKQHHSFDLTEIKEIHVTRYLLRYTALEIFFYGSTSPVYFNFASPERAKECAKKLCQTANAFQFRFAEKDKKVVIVDKRKALDIAKQYQLLWLRREISNFEYLMKLNTLAGRTYNDINQYFVFPWVISDYSSSKLDFKKNVFRDLSKPMGALNEKRFQTFLERYESFTDPEIPSFLYGSHYSTSGVVLYYLVRQEPFSTLNRNLQGNKFDHADRLFHSVASTYANCLTNSSDVKELIPEFYYQPEFLVNSNEYFMGIKQNGVTLNDVVLPPWAKDSPEEFVRINREALESEYVSEHLHEWIDLIFGSKQRGEKAVEANNVFYYLTYEGSIMDLDSIHDSFELCAIEDQIAHFGQTPIQIFKSDHPKRLPGIPISRPLYFAPASITLTSTISHNSFSVSSHNRSINITRPIHDALAVVFLGIYEGKAVSITKDQILTVRNWITPYSQSVNNFTFSQSIDPYFGFGDSVTMKRLNTPFTASMDIFQGCFSLLPSHSSPSSLFVLTCGHWDNSFQCISVSDGKTIQSIRKHYDVVSCLDVSSDGECIVTGSLDTTVMVWELESVRSRSEDSEATQSSSNPSPSKPNLVVGEKPRLVLCGHDDAIAAVRAMSELDLIVSVSRDGTCMLHSLRDGRFIRTLRHPKLLAIDQLAISHHGWIVLYSDDDLTFHVFSINGKLLVSSEAEERINCLSLSSCGEFLVSGGNRGEIVVRRIHDMSVVKRYEGEKDVPISSLVVTSLDCFLVGLTNGHLLVFSIEAQQLKKAMAHFSLHSHY